MSELSHHIGSERLQAYLEGEVHGEGREAIEAHLDRCLDCSEEAESWRLLFGELKELPALTPSAAFEGRVLSALRATPLAQPIPEPASLADRVRGLVPRARKRWSHPSAGLLQDFVEGLLATPEAARLQTHISTCAGCASEASAWKGLHAALLALPSHAPSAGFGDRVMREVERRGGIAPAPVGGGFERIVAAARGLLPSTRRGRLIAGGIVTAPAGGLVALAAVVVLHPLLSFGDLFAFMGWQGGAMARGAFSRLAQEVFGSGTFLRLYEGAQLLLASPTALASSIALGWILTLSAGWVLYRNLVAPTLAARPHVRAL